MTGKKTPQPDKDRPACYRCGAPANYTHGPNRKVTSWKNSPGCEICISFWISGSLLKKYHDVSFNEWSDKDPVIRKLPRNLWRADPFWTPEKWNNHETTNSEDSTDWFQRIMRG